MSYYKYPISDVHIHAFTKQGADETLAMVKELGYEKFNMLSGCSILPQFTGNNLLCAYIKEKSGGTGYAFAACHYPETGIYSADELLKQVVMFHGLGFDGLKMMDGKPNMRKRIGVPLNDAVFDPMFSYMESVDMPLLYHINDPFEFWMWDLMPDWAKEMGEHVFYGDGSFPTKQQIEDEAVAILGKHPRLRVIIPHWFFTSTDLERTRTLFERYPNLSYDITPGWEMFESFAERYNDWRAFFEEYSDRILFGTDTISDHWRETVGCLRRVMETDEEFVAFEENCKGLKLSGSVLRNIYKNNFDRYLPHPPRPMNLEGLKIYGQTLYALADTYAPELAEAARHSIDEGLAALEELN